MMLLMFLLKPFWLPLAVLNSQGSIDRSAPTNLLIIIPALVVFGLVERLFHIRFGSLVLTNPHWQRQLSVAERALMRQYNILHHDEYFTYGEMHFDTLQQAVEYARTQEPRPTV